MDSTMRWIRESNLIEGVDDAVADADGIHAWRMLVHSKLPIDEGVVLGIHRALLQRLDPPIAGYFRRCQVWVGSGRAPNWRKVPQLIAWWLATHAKAATERDIREAHIAFEHIHPFVDGNGRTGRMLMNYQRVLAGFDPLLIEARYRQDYYTWFDQRAARWQTMSVDADTYAG